MSSPEPAFVHPSAVVDRGAQLGAEVKVWHFCHVSSGAVLEAGVSLGQNVFVAPGVRIGAGCRIQNNVSIYAGVRLEREVFCGPSVVFTNVKWPRAHVARKDAYEPTRVKRGASLGANATLCPGVTVGRYALVGAGSVVTSDVPNHALVVGVPARQIGWVSAEGEHLRLPLRGVGEATCPRSGERYRLGPSGVVRTSAGRVSPSPRAQSSQAT